ncbi:MAG: type I methionyl aminopeptidase [Defluviitaleaceae bacterium]|nr:type I methionyl aminopeptidase [Defluviitaleaceae bacterium]
MAISVKSAEQIGLMREAGKIVAETFALLERNIRPGVTTAELDRLAAEYIRGRDAKPSFLGYRGFPANICVSVNSEVIHGIPGLRRLVTGDIVSIDIGVFKNRHHADAARTFAVGAVSPEAERLIQITRESFYAGIEFARPGRHLHEISAAVQGYAERHGYSVVREYVGHGIGSQMHEDPSIPNYKPASRGPRLSIGMALAIEPMVNAGTHEVYVKRDGWTVVTRDDKLSAHYENTVIVTADAPELITLMGAA